MIRKIEINDTQRNLLIKVMRDVRSDLTGHNAANLERHHHTKEYLHELNKNDKMIIEVESLLKELK